MSQAAARRQQAETLAVEAAAIHERIAAELLELEAARARLVDDSGDSPDRHELQRLEAHERQVQETSADAQSALLAADRKRLDLEAEVARTEAEISALEEEMEHEGLQPDRRGDVVGFDESPEHSPIGGGSEIDVQATHVRITELRRQIRRLGPVNAEAPEDYRETRERHEFLTAQLHDLSEAEIQLRSAIRELNGEVKHRFESAFEKVDAAFSDYFAAFFGGGTAKLHLTDPSNPAESGVEIEAQPPGKKVQSLALLSGGERSLTAVALLFALLTINPAPFCVLDEVDAALDEANVGRFVNSVKRLAERTQFIMITHNRKTVEVADAIYGISMNADGVSRMLSLRLDQVPEN
ncbi:MAG: AAA family ATPase [Myxococcales bacterium]|nr:AAA family ATPase [Myxococcales bacterium]